MEDKAIGIYLMHECFSVHWLICAAFWFTCMCLSNGLKWPCSLSISTSGASMWHLTVLEQTYLKNCSLTTCPHQLFADIFLLMSSLRPNNPKMLWSKFQNLIKNVCYQELKYHNRRLTQLVKLSVDRWSLRAFSVYFCGDGLISVCFALMDIKEQPCCALDF